MPGQTDRRTDTVPLHSPCSAYYVGSVSNAAAAHRMGGGGGTNKLHILRLLFTGLAAQNTNHAPVTVQLQNVTTVTGEGRRKTWK